MGGDIFWAPTGGGGGKGFFFPGGGEKFLKKGGGKKPKKNPLSPQKFFFFITPGFFEFFFPRLKGRDPPQNFGNAWKGGLEPKSPLLGNQTGGGQALGPCLEISGNSFPGGWWSPTEGRNKPDGVPRALPPFDSSTNASDSGSRHQPNVQEMIISIFTKTNNVKETYLLLVNNAATLLDLRICIPNPDAFHDVVLKSL
jgi:hypothetical protein